MFKGPTPNLNKCESCPNIDQFGYLDPFRPNTLMLMLIRIVLPSLMIYCSEDITFLATEGAQSLFDQLLLSLVHRQKNLIHLEVTSIKH
jgi:hypothetical protein